MKAEILKMLRETDSYVSGQELCNKFGVSRTAVWKAINQLKENGYEIEAVQNKGYHLLSAPDVMDAAEIKSLLHTDWAGKETLYFEGYCCTEAFLPLCHNDRQSFVLNVAALAFSILFGSLFSKRQ